MNNPKELYKHDIRKSTEQHWDVQYIYSGVETASHVGHCPINLVNVW